MKALILAAGYATRLYPLTKKFPKPLLTVNKRPIIDYIIDKLEKIEEIDEIAVVTNTRFIPQFRKWQKKLDTAKRISLVDDKTRANSGRRGAIGDLSFAVNKKKIKEDLLVVGGDNLFDEDLTGFLAFAQAKKKIPVIGVYDVKSVANASKYGVVKLNKDNRIVDFQEKPAKPKSTLAAMCLYYFPKGSLKFIKVYLKNNLGKFDASGFYIDWLRKKVPVYGFRFGGRWYDIGDRKFYHSAKRTFR